MRHNLRDAKGRFIKKNSINTIERKGDYWVDDKGNKWSTYMYSKKEAEKYSVTLIDCSECRNCRYCNHCIGCSDCIYCTKCSDCSLCRDCNYCNYCTDCTDCSDCNGCSQCTNCGDCIYCSYCIDCRRCYSFSKNPERIIGPVMGSRNDFPSVYWVESGKEQCIVGCFRGTLNELEKAVEETHRDTKKYLTQYRQFIKKVRAYQEIKI